MARISELHYSNAYARTSGVSEFLEVALGPQDDPADFTVSFYQDDGTVGFELTLDDPNIQVSVDPENGEVVYVISADDFPILLTDPDGGGGSNYEAYALTNTGASPAEVLDFYDIGGGTQNILAQDGAAAGAVSENLPVLVGPNSTTTTLQFNQPNPDVLSYGTVGNGDTGPACFVAGTPIDTPDGPRAVEDLQPGDLVLTRDHGAQPLRWIGQQTVRGQGPFAPICISAGMLGAERDICVSPQHRVLVTGWRAEILFGADEILVAAKSLINDGTVRRAPCPRVRYVHLLFDRHEIVTSAGLPSESFFPGETALDALEDAVRAELCGLFPELRVASARYGGFARPVHKGPELRLLTQD